MTDEDNIQSQPIHAVLKQYNLKRAKFQDWEEKDKKIFECDVPVQMEHRDVLS